LSLDLSQADELKHLLPKLVKSLLDILEIKNKIDKYAMKFSKSKENNQKNYI